MIGKYHGCVGLQVKEYLDNLGVEYRSGKHFGRMVNFKNQTSCYRFGCYHEKDPAACHLLGDYWEGIKKDFIKVCLDQQLVLKQTFQALRIYTTNCDEYKHAHSCHKVILLPSSQKISDKMIMSTSSARKY